MASFNVTLARVENRARNGEVMPVPHAEFDDVGTITTSATTQTMSITATGDRQYWTVSASGNDVYVNFTAAAVVGACWLIPAGTSANFSAQTGQQPRVIDA